MFQVAERTWVIPGLPPRVTQPGQRVCLAAPLTQVLVEPQGMFQVISRSWEIAGQPPCIC